MDWASFILHRLRQLVLVMVGIIASTFFLIRLVPGDPALVILGERATPEGVARLHEQLGLDKPLIAQFALYTSNLLSGDLGVSISLGTPVVWTVLEKLQATIFLTAYSIILSLVIAVPLAAFAAFHRGRAVDQIVRAIFMITMAMPSFWIGIILMLVLSVRLRLFPISGYGDSIGEHLYHLFLPALTIALYLASMEIRSLRNSILDVLSSDHVAFARSQGIPENLVFVRHIFRNSLSPTVSVLGVTVGWLLGATVVVETVFSIPGAGRLLIDSVFRRDYPIIQALIMLFAMLAVLLNLFVDLTYALLDPRIRL